MASFTLMPLTYERAFAQSSTSIVNQQNSSFEPTASKPTWVDTDNNGIADTLDQEISYRIANGTANDFVNVTVLLKVAPTVQDANDFVASGGYLTTSAWTEAVYGFGGITTYAGIATFAQKCPDVLLVEKEAEGKAAIAYAAQQVGARTYVWNTVGLQGDPNTTIAMLDTGVDASHVDFQPGYGNLDFSKKIIGWVDEIGFTTAPTDDNGHGSHVAGLATGDGFFSVDAIGNTHCHVGSRPRAHPSIRYVCRRRSHSQQAWHHDTKREVGTHGNGQHTDWNPSGVWGQNSQCRNKGGFSQHA